MASNEESMLESGKIYRNSVGVFCFVCVHCGNYFDDISETLDHIESHFEIIENDEVLENENSPMETTTFLDFDETSAGSPQCVSMPTQSLRIEPQEYHEDNDSTEWIDQNSMDNCKDSNSSKQEYLTRSRSTKLESGIKEETIECSYCSESFTHQLFLTVHTKRHHPNIPKETEDSRDIEDVLKCDKDTKEFETRNELDSHVMENHMVELTIDLKVDDATAIEKSQKSNVCHFCHRNFKSKHLLKRHLQRSTCKDEFCIPLQVGEFPFYCDICGHGFHYKFRLIHHMAQRHIGKENQCKYCGQKYVLDKSLQKHEEYDCLQRPGAKNDVTDKVAIKRRDGERDVLKKKWGGYRAPKNVQGPKMFNCEFCDKVYDSHYKLKQHLLSHANLREFKCDLCDCAYNTKPRLRRHYIYNHTDHPTFDCEVCGWKFREKNNLKRHMRLHNGDYQAQCQICSKKFTANCHLKYHLMTAHSNETPFQCDLCGKSFNSTSKMNAHRKRHIKETLPCDICGKIFGSKNRLYTHKKTHSEERNIICKVCGKNFKTAVVLRQHMYLHKGKIFSCNFCPMTFAQSSGRRTHEKLRHNIV